MLRELKKMALGGLMIGLSSCDNGSKSTGMQTAEIYREESSFNFTKIIEGSEFKGVNIDKHELGKLILPTGKIVIADPLYQPDEDIILTNVRGGSYKVNMYSLIDEEDYRIGLLQLVISNNPVNKWFIERKLNSNSDFVVKSDLIGIMDKRTADHYLEFEAGYFDELPEGNIYFDYWDQFFQASNSDDHPQIGQKSGMVTLPEIEGQIATVEPGYGTGTYQVYVGLEGSGAPAQIVIDLHSFHIYTE